eukprot:745995-Hanusia_phi.AAC.8
MKEKDDVSWPIAGESVERITQVMQEQACRRPGERQERGRKRGRGNGGREKERGIGGSGK